MLGCFATSAHIYKSTLRNIREERRSEYSVLLRCGIDSLVNISRPRRVFVLNFQNSPVTILSSKIEPLRCLETIGTVFPAMWLSIAERDPSHGSLLFPYPDNKCCWLYQFVFWNGSLDGHLTRGAVYVKVPVVSSCCKKRSQTYKIGFRFEY